jgi:CRP-like cAMP-binding protein
MDWPLLASLSESDRERLLRTARRRDFVKGEVVIHEGDPAESLHLVASGRFAVNVSTSGGAVAMLNLLSRGDFFGELALVRDNRHRQRSATVVALEAGSTLSLAAGAFRTLCESHPQVERLLVSLLAERVDELSQRLLEALYLGLERRVYRRLLDLTAIYRDSDNSAVIRLTQEHLADLVGGSRPSVNQVLQRLVAEGVVELGRGRIEVRDAHALERRAAIH